VWPLRVFSEPEATRTSGGNVVSEEPSIHHSPFNKYDSRRLLKSDDMQGAQIPTNGAYSAYAADRIFQRTDNEVNS
jgi:hypothetical protein